MMTINHHSNSVTIDAHVSMEIIMGHLSIPQAKLDHALTKAANRDWTLLFSNLSTLIDEPPISDKRLTGPWVVGSTYNMRFTDDILHVQGCFSKDLIDPLGFSETDAFMVMPVLKATMTRGRIHVGEFSLNHNVPRGMTELNNLMALLDLGYYLTVTDFEIIKV